MNLERFAVQRFSCCFCFVFYFGLSSANNCIELSSIDTNNTKVAKIRAFESITWFVSLFHTPCVFAGLFFHLRLVFLVAFYFLKIRSIVSYSLDSFCFFGLVWSLFACRYISIDETKNAIGTRVKRWRRRIRRGENGKNAQQSWSIIISLTGLSFAGW